MKKPFQTKFAVKVTEANSADIQKSLFAIGCKWYGGKDVRVIRNISELCISTLGTITCNIRNEPLRYPVFTLDVVERHVGTLADNRIRTLERKLKDLRASFLLTAEKFGEDILTTESSLNEAKNLKENVSQ